MVVQRSGGFNLWPRIMTRSSTRTTTPDVTWPLSQPLHLESVHVRRGETEVLRGVDLTFEPRRRYVIVGPSGSGKSTLLRLLNRLEDPSDGSLRIGSTPLTELPVREVRRAVGLVFQGPRPLPGSLADNLTYPYKVRGLPLPDRDRMAAALEELGLPSEWLDRDALALSGGERQRLALAVVLGIGPEILALDEPTSALDPVSARRIFDALGRRSSEDGMRTIAVTHHRGHALWLGDWCVVLDAGRVVDEGPLPEVLDRYDVEAWQSSTSSEPVG